MMVLDAPCERLFGILTHRLRTTALDPLSILGLTLTNRDNPSGYLTSAVCKLCRPVRVLSFLLALPRASGEGNTGWHTENRACIPAPTLS